MFNIGDSDIKKYIKDINKPGKSLGENFKNIIDQILNYAETQKNGPEITTNTMGKLTATTISAKDTINETKSIIAKYNLQVLLYDGYLKQFQSNINEIYNIYMKYNANTNNNNYKIFPNEINYITDTKTEIDQGIQEITDYTQNITSDNFNEIEYFKFKDVIDKIINEYKDIAVDDDADKKSYVTRIIKSLNNDPNIPTNNKANLYALNTAFKTLENNKGKGKVPTPSATILAVEAVIEKLLPDDNACSIKV